MCDRVFFINLHVGIYPEISHYSSSSLKRRNLQVDTNTRCETRKDRIDLVCGSSHVLGDFHGAVGAALWCANNGSPQHEFTVLLPAVIFLSLRNSLKGVVLMS